MSDVALLKDGRGQETIVPFKSPNVAKILEVPVMKKTSKSKEESL